MAAKERKGDNQKLKMLFLAKIFSEETDDRPYLTMPEIISRLSGFGVNADRKTLYTDFEELRLTDTPKMVYRSTDTIKKR